MVQIKVPNKCKNKYSNEKDIANVENISSVSEVKKSLNTITRVSYGFGNVLNDLCATVWFTYLLVYLNFVAELNNVLTGYLMLIGQVTNAVAIVLFGFITDRTCGSVAYGRRKTWHLIGSIAVVVAFPFLQNTCFICSHDASTECKDWIRFSYYVVFVVVLQLGWALNQISHMSLIPELSTKQSERVSLSSVRHAFSVLSSVTVYGIAFVLLGSKEEALELGPQDQNTFTILSVAVIGIGVLFTALFHFIIKERPGTLNKEENEIVKDDSSKTKLEKEEHVEYTPISWKDWLKEYQFYQVAILYTATRVVLISSQVYIPFYVNSTLHLDPKYIAIIPLIVYTCSFATALVMKHTNKILGRKQTYGLGSLLVLSACAWMWFISEEDRMQVLGAAILLGVGTSTIYVTALAIVADLIGVHTETGGFVYGLLCFVEKFTNGGTVAMVQYLYPCMSASCCSACVLFYRQVIVFIPSGATIIAILALTSLFPLTIGKLRFHKDKPFETIINVIEINMNDPLDAKNMKGNLESEHSNDTNIQSAQTKMVKY